MIAFMRDWNEQSRNIYRIKPQSKAPLNIDSFRVDRSWNRCFLDEASMRAGVNSCAELSQNGAETCTI